MKKRLICAAVFILGFSLIPATPFAFAQDDGTKPAVVAKEMEEVDYSFGTVKSASAADVVVSEYDYETDKDIDVSYVLDPKAELKNVESAEKIAAGDSIDITYVMKDGKKVAKTISVEKIPAGTPAQ